MKMYKYAAAFGFCFLQLKRHGLSIIGRGGRKGLSECETLDDAVANEEEAVQ